MNKKDFYMKKDIPIVMQIIAFPLTAYLIVATFFLLSVSKLEELIQVIGKKTKSHYFNSDFGIILYHKIHFWFTFFFFIFFPFLLIYYVGLLIVASIIYLYEYVIATVEILYEKVIEQVQLLWEKISDMFK
jgi:hypothetical protein